MTDFYIFRHGDTFETSNIWVRFFGHKHDSHDIKILQTSIPTLKKIGAYLKNINTDADFTSPYTRCTDSAQIVGEIANKKYIPDERLRELEKNGEKFEEFSRRIKNFLDEVQTKNYSAVSICTHGAVIAGIKHFLMNNKFYFFQIWDYPKPGKLLIIKNKKLSRLDFNS